MYFSKSRWAMQDSSTFSTMPGTSEGGSSLEGGPLAKRDCTVKISSETFSLTSLLLIPHMPATLPTSSAKLSISFCVKVVEYNSASFAIASRLLLTMNFAFLKPPSRTASCLTTSTLSGTRPHFSVISIISARATTSNSFFNAASVTTPNVDSKQPSTSAITSSNLSNLQSVSASTWETFTFLCRSALSSLADSQVTEESAQSPIVSEPAMHNIAIDTTLASMVNT
mmetsp:Transcript_49358/g.78102  ORF Transcript_49358/g.78102 Transcript_49358/m.78102 type:complete len:226 (-) Transcript_49358:70-747(-)